MTRLASIDRPARCLAGAGPAHPAHQVFKDACTTGFATLRVSTERTDQIG